MFDDLYSILDDPEAIVSRSWSRVAKTDDGHCYTIREALSHSCVVLLGPPGAGKSTQVRKLVDAATVDDVYFLTELRGLDSSDALRGRLSEAIAHFDGRRQGECTVVLDGLDECPIPLQTFGQTLSDYIRQSDWPYRLIVVSRTAAWSSHLQQALAECLVDLGIFELLPLTAEQVREIVGKTRLDAERFLEAVDKAKVDSLTSYPGSLALLIEDALEQQVPEVYLPTSQVELYERACIRLAKEPNVRVARPPKYPNPAEVVSTSAFMAAVAIFCGKAGYVTERDRDRAFLLVDELIFKDLAITQFSGNDVVGYLPVEYERLEEALRCALFRSAGPGKLRFFHQTIAEYLTARHLTNARLSKRQVLALLNNRSGQLAPQVQAVAAWLVNLEPSKYGELLNADPAAFIRSRVELVDDRYKEIVVSGLLTMAEDYQLHGSYGLDVAELNFPAIASTLRPYLIHSSKSIDSKYLAIRLANANRVVDVLEELTERALDESEDINLRVAAGHAALGFDESGSSAQQLKCLATFSDDDPDDELFGLGLHAELAIGTRLEVLLSRVRPPKPSDLMGSYKALLYSDLPRVIAELSEPSRVCAILEWATSAVSADGIEGLAWETFDSSPLFDSVLALGLKISPDSEAVRRKVARYVISRAAKHHDLFSAHGVDAPALADNDRRALIYDLVHAFASENEAAYVSWRIAGLLLFSRDVSWLSSKLGADASESVKKFWLSLLSAAFDSSDRANIEFCLSIPEDDATYEPFFRFWREPVLLEQRPAHLRQGRSTGPGVERIRTELESVIQDSSADAFMKLCHWLSARAEFDMISPSLKLDIKGLPSWYLVSQNLVEQISSLALRFLEYAGGERYLPETPRTTNNMVLAGLRALTYLTNDAPDKLPLGEGVWNRWAPAIPTAPVDSTDTVFQAAIEQCFAECPTALRRAVLSSLDQLSDFDFRRFGTTVGNEDELLLTICRGSTPANEAVRVEALRQLLVRSPAAARVELAEIVREESDTPQQSSLCVSAASTALVIRTADAWEGLYPYLRENDAFAEKVLLGACGVERPQIDEVDEEVLLQMYRVYARLFPANADPAVTGAHIVSRRETAGSIRERLLPTLAERGTESALRILESLLSDAPSDVQLTRLVARARQASRKRDWKPLSPSEIVQAITSQGGSVVRSSSDFLEAVLDELSEIQDTIGGTTFPQATLLWNHESGCRSTARKRCRPKTEDEVTDYVARRLSDTLRRAFVNREVQAGRLSPAGLPRRTDLLLQAFGAEDIAEVVIEVKGCWNSEIEGAADEQLVDRYLPTRKAAVGLVLGLWFDTSEQTGHGDLPSHSRYANRVELEQELSARSASAESRCGRRIESYVLDCSMPR